LRIIYEVKWSVFSLIKSMAWSLFDGFLGVLGDGSGLGLCFDFGKHGRFDGLFFFGLAVHVDVDLLLVNALSLSLGSFLFLLLAHDVLFDVGVANQIHMGHQFILNVHLLLGFRLGHSPVEETLLSSLLDLVNLLHGLQGLHHQVSVISRGDVPALLELKHGVVGHFFAVGHTGSLRPLQLPWVLLTLEELVAFGAAEAEDLGVVPHKHCAVTGVDVHRTEIALFDTHFIRNLLK